MPRPVNNAHPILSGIDTDTMPPILGYNAVKPREGCEVVLQWPEGDPALTVAQFGSGKVLAYTSDPAPRSARLGAVDCPGGKYENISSVWTHEF